jgi:hypothetical protein
MAVRRHLVTIVCVSISLAAETAFAWADEQPSTPAVPKTSTGTGEEAHAEKYKLEFKFPPKQILQYEVFDEQEISTTAREEIEIQRNTTKTKRHYRVAALDEKTGAADLEMSIDWVYMKALWDRKDGTRPKLVEFQSDDPDMHPEEFRYVLASVGKPWATIRFRTTGKPVKVVSSAMKSSDGKSLTSETGADGALDAYLIVLPDHAVAIGEIWYEKFDTIAHDEYKNRARVTIQRSYKLTQVDAGRATIELKTAILSPITNPAIASQLLLREVAGKIKFDIERGQIISKEWTVQNTVVNPIPGVTSLMKGFGRYSEKLIAEEPAPERPAADANLTSQK